MKERKGERRGTEDGKWKGRIGGGREQARDLERQEGEMSMWRKEMEWEMREQKEGQKWSSLELSVTREITPFVMCFPRKYEELSSVPSIYEKI